MTDRDAGASRSDADKRIDERFDLSPACSADERFLSCGASCKLRTDVAKYLNAPSAQHAGFDFSFPIAATDSVKENYRLFVLSQDGSAAELQRSFST